jgi:hypothetical protein
LQQAVIVIERREQVPADSLGKKPPIDFKFFFCLCAPCDVLLFQGSQPNEHVALHANHILKGGKLHEVALYPDPGSVCLHDTARLSPGHGAVVLRA